MDSRVMFRSRHRYNLFLTSNEAVLALTSLRKKPRPHRNATGTHDQSAAVLRMKLAALSRRQFSDLMLFPERATTSLAAIPESGARTFLFTKRFDGSRCIPALTSSITETSNSSNTTFK
jgi:hypothetical protein